MAGPALQRIDSAGSIKDRCSQGEWDTRVQLAACYRLIAHFGWTDSIFTHISARVPGTEDHFLINPFGMLFEEVTASCLVKVDVDGQMVSPSSYDVNRAGFVIHSAIHSARPDVECVIHTHTAAGIAISMLECGLLPASQHAQMLMGKIGYHDFEGIAVDAAERERLIADMGDKQVLVLRNHGMLVAGRTIREAFRTTFALEKACDAQLRAQASGQKIVMPSQASMAATGAVVSDARTAIVLEREWNAMLRMLDRRDTSYKD